MHRALLVAAVVVLAGCPYVPLSDMQVEEDALPIASSTTVSFACYCKPWFGGWTLLAGPGQCGGSWTVQEVPGGSAEYGTIDACGEYTAPAARPPEPPLIVAWDAPWGSYNLDGCACSATLGLEGY